MRTVHRMAGACILEGSLFAFSRCIADRNTVEAMKRLVSDTLRAVSICAVACLGGPLPPLAAAETMKPGSVFRDCPDCPEMVVVPAGSFVMGASVDEEVFVAG